MMVDGQADKVSIYGVPFRLSSGERNPEYGRRWRRAHGIMPRNIRPAPMTNRPKVKLDAVVTLSPTDSVAVASIERAPCITCPYEAKCSFDGEVSPYTCPWLANWVSKEARNTSHVVEATVPHGCSATSENFSCA